MAGLARACRCRRVTEDAVMSRYPALVHWMHAVRPLHQSVGIEIPAEVRGGKSVGTVARLALDDLARVSLDLCRGDVVIGVRGSVGPFGVRRAMTPFTEDSTVSAAQTIQDLLAAVLVLGEPPVRGNDRLRIRISRLIRLNEAKTVRAGNDTGCAREIPIHVSRVTRLAHRFVGPRNPRSSRVRVEISRDDKLPGSRTRNTLGEVIAHLLHIPVAILTGLPRVEHLAAKALSDPPRMALVAGLGQDAVAHGDAATDGRGHVREHAEVSVEQMHRA